MREIFNTWMQRYFSNEEALVLALLLFTGLVVIVFFGDMLMPLLVAGVFSFMLQGLVDFLNRKGLPYLLSVLLVFCFFMTVMIMAAVVLMPILVRQLASLVESMPTYMQASAAWLETFVRNNPEWFPEDQVGLPLAEVNKMMAEMGQWLLSFSFARIGSLITLLVYLILVPILIFFMLKDRDKMSRLIRDAMPRKRKLLDQVSSEMNRQIGHYIRGKMFEILIVGLVAYAGFSFLGLRYALLLGVLTGLSVIIPYLGAGAVTVPVVMVALAQWGATGDFWAVLVFYGVLQALDGNLLVPWLFSETLNLHPVAIIAAILVFGGLWGFWGVFFAIPLATLCKAVLAAWPSPSEDQPVAGTSVT
jgi:putative permease